jgi:transketolase
MIKPHRIIIATFVLGALMFGCSTPAEKVDKAQDGVDEAKQNLSEENQQYKKDMEDYRVIAAEKIAANEKSIEAFNARIDEQKADAREAYQKKIADLNSKNSDLKKQIADFNTDNQSHWETFKSKFNDEMDALQKAFQDMTAKK